GPMIGPENYEVGPEFHQRFVAEDPAWGRFFSPSSRAGHFLFDLPGYVVMRLEEAGVGRVRDVARCTYAEDEAFFSYRRATHRGEEDYGRQLSAIMLAP
ncbi:MAG TPA: polyphenol oxidase, partial [Thermopetrobacter sp.]|nr:polyphenol oxidase [Thermopetrobacter sp.]